MFLVTTVNLHAVMTDSIFNPEYAPAVIDLRKAKNTLCVRMSMLSFVFVFFFFFFETYGKQNEA